MKKCFAIVLDTYVHTYIFTTTVVRAEHNSASLFHRNIRFTTNTYNSANKKLLASYSFNEVSCLN